MTSPHHTRQLQMMRLANGTSEAIPATLATTTPVDRGGFFEVLDCSPSGVDLTRAPLPLIVAHDAKRLAVGTVENIKADGSKVTGTVRFGSSAEAQQLRLDATQGINSLSVGYRLLDNGKSVNGATVFRWMPYEVSVVSVPADHKAGFFRSINSSGEKMTALSKREADEIDALCKRHGVPELASRLIAENTTDAAARAAVLEELARQDEARGGHQNTLRIENMRHAAGGLSGQSGNDGGEGELIVNTLVARLGGKPKGDVLGRADCADLAVRCLELAGQRVGHALTRHQIIERALVTRGPGMHTTSDFTHLLGDAVGRVLLDIYDESPPALRAVARLANLNDFRARSVVRMASAPSLQKVGEHGEFTYGGTTDAMNAWRLSTYGRIISLSRQAMVNDDLGGFAQVLAEFAQAAARREADDLVSALVATPQVDSVDLFHADRKTLILKTLTLSGLGAAVASLRAQRSGGNLVMQEPATLVAPAALEMTARQLVATFSAVEAGDVNPWRLDVVVEPRLDANSLTAWYLVAANQRALEYGYLEGAAGVQTFVEEGFEVDGLSVKARLDFGCGFVAPVGWVKSTGAEA